MAWLAALGRAADLAVPEPVAARDGSLVVVIRDRICVLLRWLDGRFVDRRLAPVHMRRAGALAARLHDHARAWMPPSGFIRPRVDTLTGSAKVEAMAPSVEAAWSVDHPTPEDGERARHLVETLVSRADAELFARGLEVVRSSTRALGADAGSFGLIHGDLHNQNILFHRGDARAIDFDDCGWGFHLYELAVALWELQERPRFDELREALLEGYAGVRPLPTGHDVHLDALFVLRRMQILLWVLESREHPAFRDSWRTWAREELDAISDSTATG